MARLTYQQAVDRGWNNLAALFAALAAGRNPDGTVFTLPITTSPAEIAGQGRGYVVGSGRMSLSVAGNVRAIIQNPAGSGRNVIVVGLTVFGTGTSWASIYLNPTTGVPATANRVGFNSLAGGGEARVAIMRVDTDATVALSGGIETGVVLGSGGGQRSQPQLPFPIALAQGVTMGFNVPFAGAADATFTAYIVEVDA